MSADDDKIKETVAEIRKSTDDFRVFVADYSRTVGLLKEDSLGEIGTSLGRFNEAGRFNVDLLVPALDDVCNNMIHLGLERQAIDKEIAARLDLDKP